jgi:MATE family multidrug resistance protein
MPSLGVTSAGAILVGHDIGAREHDRVPKTVRLTLFVAGGWQGFVGLVYALFASLCMLPFAPPGEERAAFLETGATMLALSATWQLFDAASMTYAEALRAAGDTAFCAWARAIIAWFVFLPGAYSTMRWRGADVTIIALWLAGYLAVLALVLFLRFRAGVWRRLDLAGAEVPTV